MWIWITYCKLNYIYKDTNEIHFNNLQICQIFCVLCKGQFTPLASMVPIPYGTVSVDMILKCILDKMFYRYLFICLFIREGWESVSHNATIPMMPYRKKYINRTWQIVALEGELLSVAKNHLILMTWSQGQSKVNHGLTHERSWPSKATFCRCLHDLCIRFSSAFWH